jgi:hypothetical protein
MEFPPLEVISAVMIWIALAAWLVTALGLIRQTLQVTALYPR